MLRHWILLEKLNMLSLSSNINPNVVTIFENKFQSWKLLSSNPKMSSSSEQNENEDIEEIMIYEILNTTL